MHDRSSEFIFAPAGKESYATGAEGPRSMQSVKIFNTRVAWRAQRFHAHIRRRKL
jgi:hypothetical protein